MNEEQKKLKFLFLYSRLPDYFFQCVKYLVEKVKPGSEAWIVCYENDKNAPYQLPSQGSNITITGKNKLNEVLQWKPNLIYLSGWGDKEYNEIARTQKNIVPTIVGVDNLWLGNLKQLIATIFASGYLKKIGSWLWVPGNPQFEFVRRLGFPSSRILFNMYCADTNKFHKPTVQFNKRIIFAGRLVEYKRPDLLLKSFSDLVADCNELQDWELMIVGNGPMHDNLRQHYSGNNNISFRTFVQPEELVKLYHESSIFCLPSRYEHWGVVVHEAAAAGLTLLLSDTCGAASEFLIHGYNGAVFQSDDKTDFKKQLNWLMHLSEKSLIEMGERSKTLSQRISHSTWAANLMSVLHER